MGVIWVRRKHEEAGIGDGNDPTRRSHRASYIVKCSSPSDEAISVLGCGMIPTYGSPYPTDRTAYCQSVIPKRIEGSPLHWEVSVEWATSCGSGGRGVDPNDAQKAPKDRRPKWRGHFISMPQTFYADLDGKKFADSAFSPFTNTPTIPIYADEITITRYESVCNRQQDRGYMGKTNLDYWMGAEPQTALIQDIDFEEVFEFGAYWFLYTYKVLVCPRFWLPASIASELKDDGSRRSIYVGGFGYTFLADAGPRQLKWIKDPSTNQDTLKSVPIMTGDYYDAQPTYLNGRGQPIERNESGELTSGINYLSFRVGNATEFAPLNLTPPWY